MPRTARAIEAGLVYHVLNRGNGRLRLFRKDADFAAFESVLAEGLARFLACKHWYARAIDS